MSKIIKFALITFMVIAVGGCASIGDIGEKNESIGATLAKTDKAFTQTVRTINDLYDSGTINQDQMQEVAPYIKKGDKALDVAWEAYKAGNKDKAVEKLEAVKNVIDELKPFLEDNE